MKPFLPATPPTLVPPGAPAVSLNGPDCRAQHLQNCTHRISGEMPFHCPKTPPPKHGTVAQLHVTHPHERSGCPSPSEPSHARPPAAAELEPKLAKKDSTKLAVHDLVVARFTADDALYRARVTKVDGNKISVYYIDFGNVCPCGNVMWGSAWVCGGALKWWWRLGVPSSPHSAMLTRRHAPTGGQ